MELEVVSPALPMAFFIPLMLGRKKNPQEGNGSLVLSLKSLKMLKAIYKQCNLDHLVHEFSSL